MNVNDHDRAKRLDEYIDALNAGRPVPQVADDAELADLFATARDLHRLRAAGIRGGRAVTHQAKVRPIAASRMAQASSP